MAANQDWVRIDPAAAARHPLFGIAGWLLVFLILQALGTIYSLVVVIDDTRLVDQILGSLDGAAAFWILASLAATWVAVIYGGVATVLGFSRHAGFPKHVVMALGAEIIACLLSFKFIDLLITRYGAPGQELRELQTLLVVQIAVAALLSWYYRASARVQITYLGRVRHNDPHLAGEAGSAHSAEPHPRPATPQAPAASPPSPPVAPTVAPPVAAPAAARSLQERLTDLKALFEQGLIDEAVFKDRQAALLREL